MAAPEKTRPTAWTDSRRWAVGIVVAAAMVEAIGLYFSTKREWTCNYRFWSDGGRNPTWVTAALVFGGAALGIVGAIGAGVIAVRTARWAWAVVALAGVVVSLVWLPMIVSFAADCSSD